MARAKYILAHCTLMMLSACATSPEALARREAAAEARLRQTEIRLAAKCDPEAAQLMARAQTQPLASWALEAQADYRRHLSDSTFQACYRLAWQNLLYQERLADLERQERLRDWDDWLMFPFARHYPWYH